MFNLVSATFIFEIPLPSFENINILIFDARTECIKFTIYLMKEFEKKLKKSSLVIEFGYLSKYVLFHGSWFDRKSKKMKKT